MALPEGSVDLGTGASAAAPERRQVRINGATASATSLSEWLSVLWLTPAMDRLFSEGASGRRRFFDRLVLALEPGHASHAARYEAAMRARTKLLGEPDTADPSWLSALEAGMAEHGARVAEARERTLAALGERLAAQPEGPFARAGLAFDRWRPDPGDAEGALKAALRAGRGRDAGAGPRAGGAAPHRSARDPSRQGPARRALLDRRAEGACCSRSSSPTPIWSPSAPGGGRFCCSTRSPRTSIQAAARRCSSGSQAGGGQVWMTGTERSLFDGIAAASWLGVEHGAIHPA